MGIAQQDLDTLLATELLLVTALHALLTDIVARLVIVIGLDVSRRHFRYIAQHVGCHTALVAAHTTLLHIEAGEAEHLLLKDAEVLVAELTEEELLGESRVAGIAVTVLDGLHPAVELFLRDVQGIAELHRVQTILGLVHHHHNIIGRLIVDHQLAVAVGDDATRRELYLLQEGIRVGTLLIVVTGNLKGKQTDNVDDHYQSGHPGYHEFTIFQITVVPHLTRTLSIARIKTNVSSALLPAHSSQ